MASFARMVPGEWRRTVPTGKSTYDTWHWGPGRHSMRVTTDGSGAAGEPWRELSVFYWHPARKQVCVFTMHCDVPSVGPGVGEGTFKFEGDTADATYDLHQPRGRRKLGVRWTFDGPDKYRSTLSEATGAGGFTPLASWDYVRIPSRPRAPETAKPSERLKALEPLLGCTWEAKGNWTAGDAFHARTTFERVPLIDAIYARVLVPVKGGEPTHWLDAYVYHHVGAKALRCLALSSGGGVYEGDVTVVDGGALQFELKGHEGDRQLVRFDFEPGGGLRQRAFSLQGTERTLILDVRHAKLDSERK